MSEVETSKKVAKKRSVHDVNEHFEPLFDAISTNTMVLQLPVNRSYPPVNHELTE